MQLEPRDSPRILMCSRHVREAVVGGSSGDFCLAPKPVEVIPRHVLLGSKTRLRFVLALCDLAWRLARTGTET